MKNPDKLWENLKNLILSYILKLEKKGYTIPINDKKNELFTRNKFMNSMNICKMETDFSR